MEETLDIQQQVPQQEDPPRKKLWGLMRKKELYTKSYEDFESQFSTPEKIDKLHKFLLDKEIYTKTTQDFKTQFFSDKQEPAPSKKKLVQLFLEKLIQVQNWIQKPLLLEKYRQ